jgi:flagellar hook-associated protein 2
LTNRAGLEAQVDLSAAVTLGDVKDAIEAAGVSLSVVISGQKLIINDAADGDGATRIEDLDGGTVAASLGIDKSSETGSISGDDVYFVETLGDVLRLINDDADNGGKLSAAISADGLGLTLTDQSGGGGVLSISALNGSSAADDLGLLAAPNGSVVNSRRLVAGLDTVLLRSLNGGNGVTAGTVSLTDRSGAAAIIDLTAAATLADVIGAINASGTAITASVSPSGLGIVLSDSSGGGGHLIVADVSGTIAGELGISVDDAVNGVAGGNLQKQYVSAATLLSDLNNGLGIARGRFRITDSAGQSAVVDLTQGNEKRLQDVIDEINSRGIGVTARINDTGDGLLIEDIAGGALALHVTEEGGATASSLGVLGQAEDGATYIDGSFETRIEIDAGDTLDSLLAKFDQSRAPVDAAILNSGGGSRPFRLNLASAQSGIAGVLAIDAGATGLSFDTLAEAKNATLVFGPDDAAAPLVVTGASNSMSGVISGVRLELVAASDTPVTVTVQRDVDTIVEDVSKFVAALNAVIGSIDELSRFDAESETRGVLTGDATARRVRDRLVSLASQTIGNGALGRLSDMGITVGPGAVLKFDEVAFRQQFELDPEGVAAFFSTEETGFGAVVQAEIDRFTDADSGAIALQNEALRSSEDLLNGRIEQLQRLLERRRQRLFDQFAATESILARLQSQQAALSSLAALQLQPGSP